MTRNTRSLQVLQAKPRIAGSRIGTIVDLQRRPLVDFPGNPLAPQPARVVASVVPETLALASGGRLPVLLVFEDDDPARPVIVDVVIDELSRVPASDEAFAAALNRPDAPHADRDGSPALVGRLATIVGIEPDAVLVQDVGSGTPPVRALTSVVLRNLKEPVIVVTLADGRAVIVGQVYASIPVEPAGGGDAAEVVLRGKSVRIEADAALILKSGSCEIRLDSRGRMVTTADAIVSRARGANRVQGGSVHLN
jgi:hypothetical protein